MCVRMFVMFVHGKTTASVTNKGGMPLQETLVA